MKIGEARKTYSAPLREFWEEKKSLAKQKKALDEKIKATPSGKEAFAKEAVTLDLSYRAVSEKYEEYSKTMEQIMAQHTALFNAEVSKQQGEAMEEYSEDMIKIMEVARRIMKGAKVPASDEKKLMEYSMELYMAAKNMAVLNENKKKELNKKNITEEGKRIARFHQWLTDEGRSILTLQIGKIFALMEISPSLSSFKRKMEHQKIISIAPYLFEEMNREE